MADVNTVTSTLEDVKATADLLATVIATSVPSISDEVVVSKQIADLALDLVAKALAAYTAASGVAITPETIAALMPDMTPLSDPQ